MQRTTSTRISPTPDGRTKLQKKVARDLFRCVRHIANEHRRLEVELRRARALESKVHEVIEKGERLTARVLHNIWYVLGYGGLPGDRHPSPEMLELVGYPADWPNERPTPKGEAESAPSQAECAPSLSPSSALAEAAQIARGAAKGGVDWSREPSNERERRIRARILERILADDECDVIAIDCLAHGILLRREWPSDLRAAYETASRALAADSAQRERDMVDEAIADLNDGLSEAG